MFNLGWFGRKAEECQVTSGDVPELVVKEDLQPGKPVIAYIVEDEAQEELRSSTLQDLREFRHDPRRK
jgi:hypothetical protein